MVNRRRLKGPKLIYSVNRFLKAFFTNLEVVPSKTLQKVQVPIWDEATCSEAYQEAHYEFNREDYVCAGEDFKDTSKVHLFYSNFFYKNYYWFK